MMLRRGVHGVLGQLANEGLLTDAQLEEGRRRAASQTAATPWYVRVLIGGGAWVASWMVLGVLALSRVLDDHGALVFGVFFYGGAVALRWLTRGDFTQQLSLAFGLAGAVMVAFGVADATRGDEVVAIAACLLGCLTLAVFPDVLARFLGAVTAAAAGVLFFYEVKLGPDVAVAFIGALAGLTWQLEPRLLANPWTRHAQRPAAWGLLVTFLFAMLTTVFGSGDWLHLGPFVSGSAAVALVVVIVAVAREHGAKLTSEPVLVALALSVALAVASFRSPGVVAALYAMVLAFHRRSPVMLGVGMVFLVVFAVHFYFRMEVSLLSRGLLLLASGVVLFVARAYVVRRFADILDEELP